MKLMNDGSNKVNIKVYGPEKTLTHDMNGIYQIFQMVNYYALKITFDQNSINQGSNLTMSYEILLNNLTPVGLKDINAGIWHLESSNPVKFTPKNPNSLGDDTNWYDYQDKKRAEEESSTNKMEEDKLKKEELRKEELEKQEEDRLERIRQEQIRQEQEAMFNHNQMKYGSENSDDYKRKQNALNKADEMDRKRTEKELKKKKKKERREGIIYE
jgi:hypothetical protein